MSGLIWIQTIWHSDGIPEIDFEKKSAEDNKIWKITQKTKSSKNHLYCLLLIFFYKSTIIDTSSFLRAEKYSVKTVLYLGFDLLHAG